MMQLVGIFTAVLMIAVFIWLVVVVLGMKAWLRISRDPWRNS